MCEIDRHSTTLLFWEHEYYSVNILQDFLLFLLGYVKMCALVGSCQHFVLTCCLKMEAVCFSGILLPTYMTTRCHKRDEHNINLHSHVQRSAHMKSMLVWIFALLVKRGQYRATFSDCSMNRVCKEPTFATAHQHAGRCVTEQHSFWQKH
jgi:hypothetical protein